MMNDISISNASRLNFLVGLNTGYAANGVPDERCVEFYRRRSSRELYCAIVGNVVIPGGYATNGNTSTISGASVWSDLSGAIADRGSLPGIQLSTTWSGYVGSKNFRSTDRRKTLSISRELVGRLGLGGITSTLASLTEASEIAVQAGFRHIQVHAAHGYLFSLLVDSRINPTADDVLDQLRQWSIKLTQQDVETSLRISMRTGDHAFDSNGRIEFIERIAQVPVDFIDLSSGFYNIDKRLIYPAASDIITTRRADTVEAATLFPLRKFIYSGRSTRHDEHSLPPNVHIGLCRDLIANPDYLRDQTTGCKNLGKCHYFSRGATHITCPQWEAPR